VPKATEIVLKFRRAPWGNRRSVTDINAQPGALGAGGWATGANGEFAISLIRSI